MSEALKLIPEQPAFQHYQCPLKALKDLEQGSVRPDLLWLDINMPLMSGMEFVLAIQKKNDLARIPFVVHSTSRELSTKERFLRAGALAYIVKPPDLQAYAGILHQIFIMDNASSGFPLVK